MLTFDFFDMSKFTMLCASRLLSLLALSTLFTLALTPLFPLSGAVKQSEQSMHPPFFSITNINNTLHGATYFVHRMDNHCGKYTSHFLYMLHSNMFHSVQSPIVQKAILPLAMDLLQKDVSQPLQGNIMPPVLGYIHHHYQPMTGNINIHCTYVPLI